MNKKFSSYLKTKALPLINVLRFLIDPVGALEYMIKYDLYFLEELKSKLTSRIDVYTTKRGDK